MHDDPARGTGEMARLAATAYIAWAVFDGERARAESQATHQSLLAHRPEAIDDPYVLALVANVLLALDPCGADAAPYLDRLASMKQSSADGKLAWWEGRAAATMFYGAGRSGSIETTSLAAQAMLRAGRHLAAARGALAWLVSQRDSAGTWHSTQATVLALKALLAATGKPLGDGRPQHLEIRCDGNLVRDLAVPESQADVVQQVDLTPVVSAGSHRVNIVDFSGTAAVYQMSLRYHLPESAQPAPQEALSIDLAYDKAKLNVNDTVAVTARVINNAKDAAPMVIVDLPIPAGFAMVSEDLDKLAAAGMIAKCQLTPRSAVVYLRQLPPATPLELRYRLRATVPVKVAVPPARTYEYYNPDRQARSSGTQLTVAGAE